MQHSNPQVSIIMATYNRAHFIVETLESIKNQTFDEWECLIIDDGATDGSQQLIKKYTQADSRFQYHKRPQNHIKGLPGCRNAGLDLARGKYIVFFDDDDIVHPENLQICVTEFSMLKVDYCRYLRKIFSGDFVQKFEINTQYTKHYLGPENLEEIVSGKIPFNSCQIMWKRKCFEGYRFNENLMYAEEWEFYTRILTTGIKGISVDKILFFGRKHPKSNTGEFWNNDPVRRASKLEATKLVIENLKVKGLLSKNLIRYFIQLGIFLKERSLINFVFQKSRLGYLKKIKYYLLFDFYPVIGAGHRAKKKLKNLIS